MGPQVSGTSSMRVNGPLEIVHGNMCQSTQFYAPFQVMGLCAVHQAASSGFCNLAQMQTR